MITLVQFDFSSMFQGDRTLVELTSFLVFGDSPFANPPENNHFRHFLRIDHPLYRLQSLLSVLFDLLSAER